jgi:hypothetical protein
MSNHHYNQPNQSNTFQISITTHRGSFWAFGVCRSWIFEVSQSVLLLSLTNKERFRVRLLSLCGEGVLYPLIVRSHGSGSHVIYVKWGLSFILRTSHHIWEPPTFAFLFTFYLKLWLVINQFIKASCIQKTQHCNSPSSSISPKYLPFESTIPILAIMLWKTCNVLDKKRLCITPTVNICLAEWLRRWTRNPLGHSRVGSNPAADGISFFFFYIAAYYFIFDFWSCDVPYILCMYELWSCANCSQTLFTDRRQCQYCNVSIQHVMSM